MLFFNPITDGMAINTKSALKAAQTRAFLAGFDDDVACFLAVSVTARIFTVLFAASFAAVALSSVWGEAEFEEVIALAVWTGQSDSDGHGDILTPPITGSGECRCSMEILQQ